MGYPPLQVQQLPVGILHGGALKLAGQRKLVKREVKKPAKDYPMGAVSRYEEADGPVFEETEQPICYRCKKPIINDEYFLCTKCEHPLHKDCAIFHDGIPYCHEHITGLVKTDSITDAKVLICVYNREMGEGKIAELAKVTKEDIKGSFSNLLNLGYLRSSKFLFVKVWELTDEGMERMPILYGAYNLKNSMVQFIEDLKGHIAGKGRKFRAPDLRKEEEEVEQ